MMRDRRRFEPRILVAAAITLVALGALGISTFLGGDDGAAIGTADSSSVSSTGPSDASSTTVAGGGTSTSSGVAVTATGPPPTVQLNPSWPTKSVSRYSESDTGAAPP